MKASEALMDHIRREIESTRYGRVIVEIAEDRERLDVITESRERFETPKEIRNG